ncbi:MAG TPA: Spy/CpxP family protein refolding chaperone [Xanthobacteraceae bacterium]|nr:Spy/CpxP family protein refolding chaperone [Xanthobacteraceae bacterium]
MLKMATAGLFALLVAASPLAHAQTTGVATPERLSASDLDRLTEARIKIVKAALQLTPDQEKLWPAVENAIRTRSQDRQARLARAEDRAEQLRDRGIEESLRDRDPVDFLNQRADALAQRSTDLKNLANAWGPLYKTLSPEQRARMGLLTVLVIRDLRNRVEQRRLQAFDDDDE